MSGYRLGYFHGWSDKKAGRPYGESSRPDLDAQWDRIAAVVRAALAEFGHEQFDSGHPFDRALDALTADDIEAVGQPSADDCPAGGQHTWAEMEDYAGRTGVGCEECGATMPRKENE